MQNNPGNTNSVDSLMSSVLYLMTRYSLGRENSVAEMIQTQLQALARHPANESETVRISCNRLAEKWQSIVAYNEFDHADLS